MQDLNANRQPCDRVLTEMSIQPQRLKPIPPPIQGTYEIYSADSTGNPPVYVGHEPKVPDLLCSRCDSVVLVTGRDVNECHGKAFLCPICKEYSALRRDHVGVVRLAEA